MRLRVLVGRITLITPDNVVLAIHKQPDIIPPALINGESHAFSGVYCVRRS